MEREEHNQPPPPIYKTPSEILSTIFTLSSLAPDAAFSQETHSESDAGNLSAHHPAVVLSHVCASWRHLALDLPLLWSEVDLRLPYHALQEGGEVDAQWCRKVDTLTACFKTWEARSRNIPMTLEVHAGAADRIEDSAAIGIDNRISKIVDAILTTSSRWRTITLRLRIATSTQSLIRLFHLSTSDVPILERADIEVDGRMTWEDADLRRGLQGLLSSCGIFSTKSLRHLELDGLWGDMYSSGLVTSHPPLTFLYLEVRHPHPPIGQTLDAAIVLLLLELMPTLGSLSVKLDGSKEPGERITRTRLTVAPNLWSLELEGTPIPSGFASCLDLPALKKLHFYNHVNYDGVQGEGPTELVDRFGQSLTAFSFAHSTFTPAEVAQILSHLPNIEELDSTRHNRYPWSPWDDEYIFPLLNGASWPHNGSGETPWRCPKLRRFDVVVRSNKDTVEGSLLRFLLGRWETMDGGGGTGLSHVRVRFRKPKESGEMDIAQELRDRGVDMTGRGFDVTYSVFW